MPRIAFTPHLLKHQPCRTTEVAGQTVAEALNAVFERQPELRSYILDDQGRVRQHIFILVVDQLLRDRQQLSDPLTATSQVFVLQALSGG